MKRFFPFLAAVALAALASCSRYETVQGDPMGVKIYTLKNGLKVYMSVNKDEPRIQTYMPVRVGGKDDPSDNTGLAHYLEHMLFKGTEILGTQHYRAEKPMLEQIDSLFEVYRTLTDPAEREALTPSPVRMSPAMWRKFPPTRWRTGPASRPTGSKTASSAVSTQSWKPCTRRRT